METVKLTKNEKSVLVAIVANAKQVGDNGVEFILAGVANEMKKSIRSISATAGSLAKKGMLLTANGESYFDGVVTEAGLHEVEESDKVNQEVNNNKNQDNMEDKNFDAPVMDERIVKLNELNELKSVKMAALSKSKRPAAKANKTAAQFILERWDDEEELKNGTDFQLEELSAIVGGYIECLNFTDGSLLVCNEEGKLMNLPYNERATDLVRKNGYNDYIVGDVLICKTGEVK